MQALVRDKVCLPAGCHKDVTEPTVVQLDQYRGGPSTHKPFRCWKVDGKFGLRLARKEAVTYATEDTIVATQTALNITGDATHAGAQEQRDSMKSTGDGNQSDTSSDGDDIPLARFRKSNPRTQGTAKAAGGPEGEKTVTRQEKGNQSNTSSDSDDIPLAKRRMSHQGSGLRRGVGSTGNKNRLFLAQSSF